MSDLQTEENKLLELELEKKNKISEANIRTRGAQMNLSNAYSNIDKKT